MPSSPDETRQLMHLRDTACRFIAILSASVKSSKTPEIVDRELKTLHVIALAADHALRLQTPDEKQAVLDGINKACGHWMELGFSEELFRAIMIQNLPRIEPASNAVN